MTDEEKDLETFPCVLEAWCEEAVMTMSSCCDGKVLETKAGLQGCPVPLKVNEAHGWREDQLHPTLGYLTSHSHHALKPSKVS